MSKNIFQLLDYGKFLKYELSQLYYDLEKNQYGYRKDIINTIDDIKNEINKLNKLLGIIDDFNAEEFFNYICDYLNKFDNNYVYSRITTFDYNNYGVYNHNFIFKEDCLKYIDNDIKCEYEIDYLLNNQSDEVIHIEDSKFSLIDSNFNINHELAKKNELIDPIYNILQMKLDYPSINNNDRLNNAFDVKNKELTKC